MPSLLQKNSFFDPSSGRQFVATETGFYWKEAKKSPEDSKVTKLLTSYGWELRNGNDSWLIFKRPRQSGELFVIRGDKKWYFDMPNEPLGVDVPEGQGLESLKQALDSGVFGGRAKAMHAGAMPTVYTGPERRKDHRKRQEWDRSAMYDVSISRIKEALRETQDPAERQELENEIVRLTQMRGEQTPDKVGGAAATAVNNAGNGHGSMPCAEIEDLTGHMAAEKPKCPHCGSGKYELMPTDFETAKCDDCGKNWDHGIVSGINDPYEKAARETMHDDSGALTGLRNRPDYGESDSYTVQMNDANAKGASILVLDGGTKIGSEVSKTKLYVTGATYNGMTLEKFTFSPDHRKAAAFPKMTAQNLSLQLKGKFGVTANLLPTKP